MAFETVVTVPHRIIDKPAHEHFVGGHHAQKLAMVAYFHHIVRRWCGRAAQTVWGLGKRIDQCALGFAHITLEDTALVQHYADEMPGIKVTEHLVVGDADPRLDISL